MALNAISSRLAVARSLSVRVCTTSNASMSSSSAGGKESKLESTKSTKKDVEVGKVVKKRESWRSFFADFGFGKYVDPADPNEPPIPAEDIKFPHVVEQSTGVAKLFLLAYENGVLDPYCNLPVERKGRGSKDNPVPIPSFLNERIVACACEPTQNHLKMITLYRGEPKRCSCGHWMELVDAPKFWEKIPKEDLLEIPYFKLLEAEGKLDDVLAGKDLSHPKLDHH